MTVLELRNDPNQKSGYLDGLSDEDCHELQRHMDKYEMKMTPTELTPEARKRANRDHARWAEHTSGTAYVLYVENRTHAHSYRVQSHGKNVYQAVRRYYRGLHNDCNHVWKCTKVVAVYTCANEQTSQAGELLHGEAQANAPW